MENLKDTMLSEVSWSQKDKFHLYEIPRVVKFIETEDWLPGPGGGRGRMESCCLMNKEFQFGKMKKSCRWIVVMIAQP